VSMSTEIPAAEPPGYDVGVAIAAIDLTGVVAPDHRYQRPASAIPGYEDARGGRRGAAIVEKGEKAVNAAIDAMAGQIGRTAERIANNISRQVAATSASAEMCLESVEISFGITLTAGMQTMFTLQSESSAQVTITLVRKPDVPPSTPEDTSQ
jgi:hypothetical protein